MKFLVKKSATKTFQKSTEAHGEGTLSRAHVFEWYKWFSGGKDSVKVDKFAGHPRTNCLKGPRFTSVEKTQARTENLMKSLQNLSYITVTSNGSTECRSV
ncbi:hypothetical protein TNCV_1668441 [Trichonephila clavipes]|nr:hypothetical protein TNCV_1668441 [Trichonephila clavipes]